MEGKQRREKIIELLRNSSKPVSGDKLAEEFMVSRQVIVQDIALIRANGVEVYSTNRGYVISGEALPCSRVFKMIHTDEEVETEMNLIVDMGGMVEDVFVYHKVYGVVKAQLGVKSRKDVKKYLESVKSGKSTFLKNITSDFHYHTVTAASEEELDAIQEQLAQAGFLAKLLDYEPVDFWKKN